MSTLSESVSYLLVCDRLSHYGLNESFWRPNILTAVCCAFTLVKPIAVNVGNLSRPTADRPALLKHSEVRCSDHLPFTNPLSPILTSLFFTILTLLYRPTRSSTSLVTSVTPCQARHGSRSSTFHGLWYLILPPWPWTFWKSPVSCWRTGFGNQRSSNVLEGEEFFVALRTLICWSILCGMLIPKVPFFLCLL